MKAVQFLSMSKVEQLLYKRDGVLDATYKFLANSKILGNHMSSDGDMLAAIIQYKSELETACQMNFRGRLPPVFLSFKDFLGLSQEEKALLGCKKYPIKNVEYWTLPFWLLHFIPEGESVWIYNENIMTKRQIEDVRENTFVANRTAWSDKE
jgi:hypothetical protein